MRPQTVNSGLTLDDRPEQDPSRRPAAYSWCEIASRLGTTRQAAQQRWGQ